MAGHYTIPEVQLLKQPYFSACTCISHVQLRYSCTYTCIQCRCRYACVDVHVPVYNVDIQVYNVDVHVHLHVYNVDVHVHVHVYNVDLHVHVHLCVHVHVHAVMDCSVLQVSLA